MVLGGSAHLWHNRPGLDVGGAWKPRARARQAGHAVSASSRACSSRRRSRSTAQLLEIHKLNADLMAHLASYALVETDWRDLKVACAALMLVQARAGAPVHDDDGSVAFYDDDFRRIGEAMVLWYQKKSNRDADAEGGAAHRGAARDAGDRRAQPRGGLR